MVITGHDGWTAKGANGSNIPVARVTDMFSCPTHGVNPIIYTPNNLINIMGQMAAVQGAKTACGAILMVKPGLIPEYEPIKSVQHNSNAATSNHQQNHLTDDKPKKTSNQPAFHNFTEQEVEQGINARMANPNLVDQGATSLCGAAVVTYFYAKHKPNDYKQFVKSLHKNGEATSAAGYHLRKDQTEHLWDYERYAKQGYPRASGSNDTINPVDFMLLASLRTQENGALKYEPKRYEPKSDKVLSGSIEGIKGMSLPNEVEKLMRELIGFKKVINQTNLAFSEPNFHDVVDYAAKLQRYLTSGFSVALLVSMSFLYNKKPTLSFPEHWVGLGSISVDKASKMITMQLFTWGKYGHQYYWNKTYKISFDVFIDTLYGYVAGI
jgi:uncharacterized Zn-binding protein involved in type VI secretion